MRSTAQLDLIQMLLARLEGVPADSVRAQRASGLRGSLLNAVENGELGSVPDEARLRRLTEAAFEILWNAARERA